MNETYSIDILGQKIDLVLKNGNLHDIQKIATYYKKITEKIVSNHPHKTSVEVAILAGIMVTEEFYSMLNKKRIINPDFDTKADSLITEAIKVLEKSLTI